MAGLRQERRPFGRTDVHAGVLGGSSAARVILLSYDLAVPCCAVLSRSLQSGSACNLSRHISPSPPHTAAFSFLHLSISAAPEPTSLCIYKCVRAATKIDVLIEASLVRCLNGSPPTGADAIYSAKTACPKGTCLCVLAALLTPAALLSGQSVF